MVDIGTGDDVGDHTDRSLWLGEKLELNIESLRATWDNLTRHGSGLLVQAGGVARFLSAAAFCR